VRKFHSGIIKNGLYRTQKQQNNDVLMELFPWFLYTSIRKRTSLNFDRIQTHLLVTPLIILKMSGLDHPNMEHYAYEQAPEFNYYLCMNIISLLIFP
jgi:hypothetical protein